MTGERPASAPLVRAIVTPAHRAMHRRIVEFLQSATAEMSAPEVLAIAAHIVGGCIALQDQRTMNPEQALELVAQNIDAGNAQTIAELATKTAGRA